MNLESVLVRVLQRNKTNRIQRKREILRKRLIGPWDCGSNKYKFCRAVRMLETEVGTDLPQSEGNLEVEFLLPQGP